MLFIETWPRVRMVSDFIRRLFMFSAFAGFLGVAMTRISILVLGLALGGGVIPSMMAEEPVGYLHGTWDMVCSGGHVDTVDDYTKYHVCEKCGEKGVGKNGVAKIRCRKCGTTVVVKGVTESHTCPKCKKEMCVDRH